MTAPFTYEFDAPDADVVLVSDSEEYPTKFNVHRNILIAASPFFETLFRLPQPPSSSASNEYDNGEQPPRPLIPMPETSVVLDSLLRFIYPTPDPPISSLEQLSSILEAAVKYDLDAVLSSLRRILIEPRFAKAEPSRVYAIATRYELEEEAKVASKCTLKINILDCPLSDDLKFISAYSYHRLLNLHRQRARDAQKLLQGTKLPDGVKCMQCNGSAYSTFLQPKWWDEFSKKAEEELRVRPTTDVIFGLKFLAEVARGSGCPRCPQSMLESYGFLDGLKSSIDGLRDTI